MYHNIPFPLPNTFFYKQSSNNEKSYDELIYNDSIHPMIHTVHATQSVILITDYHRMITKYNIIIKLQLQIFEIALQSLPMEFRSQVKMEYLPNGCMENIELHYHMVMYLTPYRCLTEALNELTQPPVKTTNNITITTEDEIERIVETYIYEDDSFSYTDRLLIDMNKEQITLDIIDNVNVDIKLTPYCKQILNDKLRDCKLRNKRIKNNNNINANLNSEIEQKSLELKALETLCNNLNSELLELKQKLKMFLFKIFFFLISAVKLI